MAERKTGHPLFISKAECKTPEDFARFEAEQELRKKGQRRQKEEMAKRKKMMEDLDEMLGYSFDELAELQKKKKLNAQQEILHSQMIEARNGNTKAFSELRDTSGEKPKTDYDINTNIEALKNMQELAKAMLGKDKKESDD